ncbi:chain length determinant protein tyrosine kinase EpsG [Aquabacterium sp. J223]|uniref:chain length determinant protein tyrosine kinase EpsG n=1 Tax=Aquabacterium sp. J223 TaxID=2898431 RepID=UPI0021AD6BD1|nr:chain length determinant protein tyrosine kinase EpsG [Aquabacterium sp. J223]UUX96848.1 chain length determinant protein tyrosine kinase EpsG [Aquabacterium sp. J223]
MSTVKMMSGKARNADRSIGAILVDSGRLLPSDAERILQYQKEHGLPFGEAGVQLGLLTEADILYALSLQFDYPFLSGPNRPVSDEIIVAYRPFSVEGERLRSLRSQLQLRWFDEHGKRSALALVGTRRGEGRSHLAANLAVTFAQAGERTLLIDGDLRNPRQHRLFKLENQVGLSSLLAGRLQDQVVSFVPGIPGLAVLPAGPPPPNPEELLGRPAFDRVLQQSMSAFDVVLIDTPSMDTGADAMLLSRFAGAALAIARTGLTRTNAFGYLLNLMQDSGVKVVGSALVDVPPLRARRRSLFRRSA